MELEQELARQSTAGSKNTDADIKTADVAVAEDKESDDLVPVMAFVSAVSEHLDQMTAGLISPSEKSQTHRGIANATAEDIRAATGFAEAEANRDREQPQGATMLDMPAQLSYEIEDTSRANISSEV